MICMGSAMVFGVCRPLIERLQWWDHQQLITNIGIFIVCTVFSECILLYSNASVIKLSNDNAN
jgi:hypothetical protein